MAKRVCRLLRYAARVGFVAGRRMEFSRRGSQATNCNCKKKSAGLMPDEMRRLKQLEHGNGRLKRIAADLTLDREMLQDVIRRRL